MLVAFRRAVRLVRFGEATMKSAMVLKVAPACKCRLASTVTAHITVRDQSLADGEQITRQLWWPAQDNDVRGAIQMSI